MTTDEGTAQIWGVEDRGGFSHCDNLKMEDQGGFCHCDNLKIEDRGGFCHCDNLKIEDRGRSGLCDSQGMEEDPITMILHPPGVLVTNHLTSITAVGSRRHRSWLYSEVGTWMLKGKENISYPGQ